MPKSPCPATDARDLLNTVLAMIAALQDGVFSPDCHRPESLTLYGESLAGMSAILDCMADKLKEAENLLETL